MHVQTTFVAGLVLIFGATASAQELVFRAVATTPTTSTAPLVSLGQPQPLDAAAPANPAPPPFVAETPARAFTPITPRIVRGQMGAPPPPPSFPGAGDAPFTPVPAGNPYNLGVVNNNSDLGNFWVRCGDKMKRCWGDITGSFTSGPGYRTFGSDREFEVFSSPVSNPFYFEDPRSLTEIRPIFIWQHTPGGNPAFNGGNNFIVAAAGSLAFTQNLSLVVNRIGFEWINPNGSNPDFKPNVGFTELLLGPKITFLRNSTSNTVAAFGITFDIAAGSPNIQQNTGRLSVVPYFSIAQNFWRTEYGSFNFMNTDGYSFRTDSSRSDSFFASFHLDYDVGNLKKFYPLVEMNYRYYSRNGNARAINFEANDLGNYGATMISGSSELTLALGARYRFNDNIQFGIVGEFNVLNNSGGTHLDQFRLTTDLIFRY